MWELVERVVLNFAHLPSLLLIFILCLCTSLKTFQQRQTNYQFGFSGLFSLMKSSHLLLGWIEICVFGEHQVLNFEAFRGTEFHRDLFRPEDGRVWHHLCILIVFLNVTKVEFLIGHKTISCDLIDNHFHHCKSTRACSISCKLYFSLRPRTSRPPRGTNSILMHINVHLFSSATLFNCLRASASHTLRRSLKRFPLLPIKPVCLPTAASCHWHIFRTRWVDVCIDGVFPPDSVKEVALTSCQELKPVNLI